MTRSLSIALVATLALGGSSASHATGMVGEPAANFSYTGLDGATYTLNQYRGKVVLLNFFGWN